MAVQVIEKETLHDWEGEFKFFWRAKTKALELAARQQPELPLLYLDSDTLLYGSLPAMRQQLAALDTFDFQALPIKQRVRSTQSRLENLTHRLWPPQNVKYLG